MAQLVIFTDSHDTTADLIIRHIAHQQSQLFRLNYDLFSEYRISVSPGSFAVEDPVGRVASSGSITKFLYRKPNRPRQFTAEIDRYVEGERWASMRAIISTLWRTDRVVLVEPFDASIRLDKITQLDTASQFFKVPKTLFTSNCDPRLDSASVLTKSLSGMWVGQRLLYATRIDAESLNPSHPWLSQECVDAKYDITVVFIRGRLFAYRLDRAPLLAQEIVDWKEDMDEHGLLGWEWFQLSSEQASRIVSLMSVFKLDYGRLDFLMNNRGELVFLEVNPNGQFAWLDINNSHGVISSYCEAVDPATNCPPIPWSPYS